jgi:hypothetical protein
MLLAIIQPVFMYLVFLVINFYINKWIIHNIFNKYYEQPSSSSFKKKYKKGQRINILMLKYWITNKFPIPILWYNDDIYNVLSITEDFHGNILLLQLINNRNRIVNLSSYDIDDNYHKLYFCNAFLNYSSYTSSYCVSIDNTVFVKCLHNKLIKKCVGDLKRGDLVLMENGYFEEVYHVFFSSSSFLCKFYGGLEITDNHPIKDDNGEWVLPKTQEYVIKKYGMFKVCSILLDRSVDTGIMINGIPVCALGHGHINPCSGNVLDHWYYGLYYYWYIRANLDENM